MASPGEEGERLGDESFQLGKSFFYTVLYRTKMGQMGRPQPTVSDYQLNSFMELFGCNRHTDGNVKVEQYSAEAESAKREKVWSFAIPGGSVLFYDTISIK